MPRATWDGSIQFGLVHIGVALYPMTKNRNIDLDLLDKRDFAPVGYHRVNKETGDEVEWDQIVKGYQYEKGQYVVLSKEELVKANPEANKLIQVDKFIPSRSIDFIYYKKPYWIVPDKKSKKSFELFRMILQETNKVALARFVLRTKESFVAIIPTSEGLVLEDLRYESELRDDLPEVPKHGKLTAAERKLAKRLIDDLSGKFEPKKVQDTYQKDLMNLIEEKVASGKTHELDHSKPEYDAPVSGDRDLMALLKKSLLPGAKTSKTVRKTKKKKASGRKKK